jgi:hypothetical protein
MIRHGNIASMQSMELFNAAGSVTWLKGWLKAAPKLKT